MVVRGKDHALLIWIILQIDLRWYKSSSVGVGLGLVFVSVGMFLVLVGMGLGL